MFRHREKRVLFAGVQEIVDGPKSSVDGSEKSALQPLRLVRKPVARKVDAYKGDKAEEFDENLEKRCKCVGVLA